MIGDAPPTLAWWLWRQSKYGHVLSMLDIVPAPAIINLNLALYTGVYWSKCCFTTQWYPGMTVMQDTIPHH